MEHLDQDACMDIAHQLVAAADRRGHLEHVHRCPRCERRLWIAVGDREWARSQIRRFVRQFGAGQNPADDA